MFVNIDGSNYKTVPRKQRDGRIEHVSVLRLDDFVPRFNTEGGQTQSALADVSTKTFGPWIRGFSGPRILAKDADRPESYEGFFDSTAETRFSTGARAGILAEDSTDTNLEVIRAAVNHKGILGGIWEDDTGTDLVWAVYTATAWDSTPVTIIATANNTVGFDVRSYKDNLIAHFGSDDDHHTYYSSDDGATWQTFTTVFTGNLFTGALGSHEDIRGGLLGESLDELVGAIWDEDNNQILFRSSTTGTAWSASDEIAIPSANGPLGLAEYPGEDDLNKLYLLTVEGLWEIDTLPGTWTSEFIRPLTSSNATGGTLALGEDGTLWIACGHSENLPADVIRMSVSGGRRTFEPVPGNLSDVGGIPSDMLGPFRKLIPHDGFMYGILGGGAASRNARVMCHNGFGWHSMWKDGTANRKTDFLHISSHDDDVERLHFGIRTSSSASDTQFLAYPSANPEALSGTIKHAGTSIIDLPYMDGGMPTTDSVWLQTQVSAANLSAAISGSSESINFDYVVETGNGAELDRDSPTDLGNILENDLLLGWPAASPQQTKGVGVAGLAMALRANILIASGDTDDPILRYVTQVFIKEPSTRLGYEVMIDLEGSADGINHAGINEVSDNLNTAQSSTVLVPFLYGPKQATAAEPQNVKLTVDYSYAIVDESGIADPSLGDQGVLKGVAIVRMREPV